jgi:hypothetical protein
VMCGGPYLIDINRVHNVDQETDILHWLNRQSCWMRLL